MRDRVQHTTIIILQIIVILLFNTSVAYSKEYRVTQKGGTLDKQIEEILLDVKNIPYSEDIYIRIDGGYYSLPNTINIDYGAHQIIISGARNRKTIISGSVEVKGWNTLPNGLWRASLLGLVSKGTIPDQLYVNGDRAIRARTPNDGFFILSNSISDGSTYGVVLKEEDARKISRISNEDIPILSIYRKWTVSKRYLMNLNKENFTLWFKGLDFPTYNPITAGNGLVLENTLNAMDTPGEWCVTKDGYIYYYPKEGETIESTVFRVPIVETLIKLSSINKGTVGICLKNLVFEHTKYHIPPEGSELGQAASRMSAAIEVDEVKNFLFEECEIRNTANYGIWLRHNCFESTINHCYFHDLGAGAIKVGLIDQVDNNEQTSHISIDNNIIYNYGVLMENAVGIILCNASDCHICHNDIHYGNYTGISLGWYRNNPSKRNEVAYNRISHIGSLLLNDLGGIYTLGKMEGSHIHHNIISEVHSGDYLGWGIYADELTSGLLVDKNIVTKCTSGGYHQHYGSNNIVTNNIFAWGEQSQFTFTSSKGDNPLTFTHNIVIMDTGLLLAGDAVNSEKFVVGNNCYWSTSVILPKVGRIDVNSWLQQKDLTSVYENPGFIYSRNGSFRIKNKRVIKMIGFEEFECSKAGVYGKRKWKKLAQCYR